jgi:hypothetical protein
MVRVTTAGGSALAALGESTVGAKNGAASSATANVEGAAKNMTRAIASKPPKPRSAAAQASMGRNFAARRLDAQARVKMSSASAGGPGPTGGTSPFGCL